MKTRRTALLMVILLTICVQLFAQLVGRQQVDQFTKDQYNTKTYGLTWLPSDYSSTTTNYPVIIFLHGTGEAGTGVAGLSKLIGTGLPQLIANGWDPQAVNPADGKNYKFIVISPQAPSWSYGYPQIQYIINDAVKKYRIDTSRIYLTGLSAGGAGTWAGVTNGADFAKTFPAIVAVSAAGTNSPAEATQIPLVGGTYGTKVWSICGTADAFWNLAVSFTDQINNAVPAPAVPAILTPFTGLGHGAAVWNTAFDANWRTNSQNMNIFEWMLQYKRNIAPSTTSVNIPPVANAGNDTAITLPVNTVNLSGSGTDADGIISNYQWTKISGPVSYSITSSAQASTSVSNLVAGTYQFQLSVTDNSGDSSRDTVIVTVNPAPAPPPPAANKPPITFAGKDTTITLPANSVALSGSATDSDGTIVSYKWSVINGPSAYSFNKTDSLVTVLSGLVAGTYNLRFVAIDNSGDSGVSTVAVKVLPIPAPVTVFATANDMNAYVPYTGKYSYGVNQGYYTASWSSQNTATIAMGSQAAGVKGAGVKSLRIPIYDDFLTSWGLTAELKDIQYYASIGANEITAFVGSPASIHRLDTTFPGSPEPSKVFKNLYEPIWLDSAHTQINTNNYYAKYLYDVVKTYGQYVKFWEIVNEPDFTYSESGWMGDGNPIGLNSWFYHNPDASELVNLRAPLFYYLRELRVAWEVIKKLSPNSYICTGGIGYRSFLDAILRNTDNPVDGSVTAEYPLKAGAYFDVLSFHSYPEFYLKKWNNTTGTTDYFRHSDSAVKAFLNIKDNMESLMESYGYNGSQFPKKQFICTETGVSRVMGGTDWGSNEGQKNYMIKAQVASQRASIKQVYWYQLGDMNTTNQFDQMGLYYYFGNNTPYTQTLSDQGKALKTTSDLLYGKVYDSVQSAALKLPAGSDGAAFKATDGSYTYVLWARTTTDLSETASALYTFPVSIAAKVVRKEWDFSQTGSTTTIMATGINLNATPSFFEVASSSINITPVANAGKDTTITLPANTANLNGSGSDADGSITAIQWTKISGPAAFAIADGTKAQTTVTNLVQGIYKFELSVTDNSGAISKDTMTVTVNATAPANIAPTAFAGKDTSIVLPAKTANLNGSGTDADGSIVSYKWAKISGPASFNFSNAALAQTSVTNLTQGSYQFELSVTDNKGAIGKDTMVVNVNAGNSTTTPTNHAPVAHAGNDTTVFLPVNSIQLKGYGTDADGTIAAYKWSMIHGPASYSIAGGTLTNPTIRYLVQGTYQFELTVTDDKGMIGKDTITVTVKAAVNMSTNASVFPNPASTNVYVKIDGSTHGSETMISMYDARGILVFTDEFIRTQEKMIREINVSGLIPGTYFIRITSDNGTSAVLKFVKQ